MVDAKKTKKRKRPSKELFWAKIVVAIVGIVVTCQIAYNLNHWGNDASVDVAKIGQFGDSFGFINAVASSLAFAGAIFAILLQRRELQLQRRVAIDSRDEVKKTVTALNAQIALMRSAGEYEAKRYADHLLMILANDSMKSVIQMKNLVFQRFEFDQFENLTRESISNPERPADFDPQNMVILNSMMLNISGQRDEHWFNAFREWNAERAVARSQVIPTEEREFAPIAPDSALNAIANWFAFIESVASFYFSPDDDYRSPVPQANWYRIIRMDLGVMTSLSALHAHTVTNKVYTPPLVLPFDHGKILFFWCRLRLLYDDPKTKFVKGVLSSKTTH
ncbi:hypothetical protein [Lacunimicrobium album]